MRAEDEVIELILVVDGGGIVKAPMGSSTMVSLVLQGFFRVFNW